MGAFLKDVDDFHEAEVATRSGLYGALLLAAFSGFNTYRLFTGENALVLPLLPPFYQFMFYGTTIGTLGIALLAAWHFRLNRGLLTGAISLAVFIVGLVWQHMNGSWYGLIWYALFFGITLSLINGLRGAWAIRTMHSPEGVVETFE